MTFINADGSCAAMCGNGLRIAFQSDADLTGGNPANQTEVFVVDWDGTDLAQLTSTSVVLAEYLVVPTSVRADVDHFVSWRSFAQSSVQLPQGTRTVVVAVGGSPVKSSVSLEKLPQSSVTK